MYSQRFIRVLKRLQHNPAREIRSLFWRIRDYLFVQKVGAFYKYKGDLYPEYLTHGNMAKFISETAKEYCHGRGLDIGAGPWPLEGAIPVEATDDINAYKLDVYKDGSLDYIFSSHCLEHLAHWQEALELWIKKIRPEGILFLYLPHKSMKMWSPGGPSVHDNHVWAPTVEELTPIIEKNGMKIIDFNPERDMAWSFHVVARKK